MTVKIEIQYEINMFQIESSLTTTKLKASNIRKKSQDYKIFLYRIRLTYQNKSLVISQFTELEAHNLHHNNQYH